MTDIEIDKSVEKGNIYSLDYTIPLSYCTYDKIQHETLTFAIYFPIFTSYPWGHAINITMNRVTRSLLDFGEDDLAIHISVESSSPTKDYGAMSVAKWTNSLSSIKDRGKRRCMIGEDGGGYVHHPY